MALFQAKIVWKWPRKRENKNYRFVPFLPDPLQKIPQKQQKNSKTKNIPLWLNLQPKQFGNGQERENIKIIVPLRSFLTSYRKLQKNIKK